MAISLRVNEAKIFYLIQSVFTILSLPFQVVTINSTLTPTHIVAQLTKANKNFYKTLLVTVLTCTEASKVRRVFKNARFPIF